MTNGPVQMLVIGFEGVEFRGEIAEALDRLGMSDTIRVLAIALVVKDEDGRVRIAETQDGDAADAAALEEVADALAPGSAAAIALLEHRWAIPLREAIARAGGQPISDVWLTPEDLARLGVATEAMGSE
jgi:hypothetical protein